MKKTEFNITIAQGISAMVLAALLFVIFEPSLGIGATTESKQFTISQTVGKEIAFVTSPSNVTMNGSIGGLTGGTATGGTQVVVRTNSSSGYQMTLTASSSLGMLGNSNPSNYIPAYVPATPNIPDFAFTVPANSARFGYSVDATTTSDVATIFKDNGASCNQSGGSRTAGACWLNASSTAVVIINRNSATPNSGATTTLNFRVTINPNPNPLIPDDTYVATTTLTATVN